MPIIPDLQANSFRGGIILAAFEYSGEADLPVTDEEKTLLTRQTMFPALLNRSRLSRDLGKMGERETS